MAVNQARTHSSSELAFRNHCDFACALTVYLSPWGRIANWFKRALRAKR
jgi:hypothetical protein